ncbi:putative arginyl-tRNA--protein transferase 2 [Iris pallida]|uniref:Arginyl-tRNA--protein transferase n=1 Tax=Iris pallida TaxID=29817 RepID=A0AAX6HAG2_IRIPA|nr:putative arginyl-tRNA--protein transferase 2 [Iris pallida]
MGDGASSSSTRGRGGEGGGESVVIDHGRMRSSCGYCGSSGSSSVSHGLWAHSITVDDYQELLDRGWRRSGCFLYKPEMDRTCCPSYTIRLKAGDFVCSKELVRVNRKMERYLDGTIDGTNKPERSKHNFSEGSGDMAGNPSSTAITQLLGKESPASICAKMCQEEFINHLSKKIDESVSACVVKGEFPSYVQLPKAVVKRVTSQTKKKLVDRAEDLLYTSSIPFQIAAVLRRALSAEGNETLMDSPNSRKKGEANCIPPNIVAEKLADSIVQDGGNSGLIVKACNGHLNFYSSTRTGSLLDNDACMRTCEGDGGEFKQTSSTHSGVLPCRRKKLEIRMKRSSFDPEEFALYRRYQIKVHNDKPEKVTESSYRRFLVDTPLVMVPARPGYKTVPPCGFGSFHQQYLLDGKLVAVGVVDILPRCLSSKYLFWDPDLAFLSLGKYSALQEINWVKEVEVHCHSLQYYYLGYYIHSCKKMRYKAAYRPSELLCPLRYEWVPFDIAKPLLDEKPYVILSDYVTLKDHARSKLTSSSIGSSVSGDMDNPNKAFSDEEEIGLDLGDVDADMGNESVSEASDGLTAADVDNITIDLNGSRVKFKDLQQVFGPIEKRHIKELEMQLLRYVEVAGKDLSNRMIYSLG